MGFTGLNRHLKLLVALAISAYALPLFAQTVDNDPKIKAEVMEKVASIMAHDAFVPGIDFTKWPEFVKAAQPDIDAAKNDEEFQHAVNTALRKFGASHVMLMTPRASMIRRTGSTVGIGISTQASSDGLTIVRVVKDGPADKAGLMPGDVIVEVDGKPVSGLRGMMGEEGSEVSFKAKHSDGKVESYKLVRRSYSTIQPPELLMADKDTAVIKIYSFDTGYDRQAIDEMVRSVQAAKNLVIDLRDNGGGRVSNLQHLLGLFIPPSKPLGTFLQKTTIDDYAAKTGGNPTDLASIAHWSDKKFIDFRREDSPFYAGHIAVLVNRFSGSASEIAAAALHDVLGVPIIGTKSAGAVLASTFESATNGFMLQFPFEDYVTIKGVRLEGTGVTPDIDAAESVSRTHDGKDEAIEKACAYFAQAK